MNLQDIKARHAHIESQERTQSVELMNERRSKSHGDRKWLIERLEEALVANERLRGQNGELEGQLGRLSHEVEELRSQLKPEKKVKKGVSRAKKAKA